MKAVELLERMERVHTQWHEGAIFATEAVFAIARLVDESLEDVKAEHDDNLIQGIESGVLYERGEQPTQDSETIEAMDAAIAGMKRAVESIRKERKVLEELVRKAGL